MNAKKGSAEFNQVMSDLTYKIIENNVSVGNLANATDEEVAAAEKKIAATLRENGVTNTSAVAHDYVTKKKLEAKYASIDLANGVELDITALKNDATACGVTTNAYLELIAKEILFDRNDLDVSDKVAKLNQIATAAGVATIKMQELMGQFDSQESKNKYIREHGGSVTTTTLTPTGDNPFSSVGGEINPTKIIYTTSDGTTTEDFEEALVTIKGQEMIESIRKIQKTYKGKSKKRKMRKSSKKKMPNLPLKSWKALGIRNPPPTM